MPRAAVVAKRQSHFNIRLGKFIRDRCIIDCEQRSERDNSRAVTGKAGKKTSNHLSTHPWFAPKTTAPGHCWRWHTATKCFCTCPEWQLLCRPRDLTKIPQQTTKVPWLLKGMQAPRSMLWGYKLLRLLILPLEQEGWAQLMLSKRAEIWSKQWIHVHCSIQA